MSDTLDPVAIATSAGHGAAVNLCLAMGLDGLVSDAWASLGIDSAALHEADPVGQLGAYVCGRQELVAPETLYRKAHELGLHAAPADAFARQDLAWQLAYTVFAGTVGVVHRRLVAVAVAARPAPAAPAKPKLEDTIYERLDDSGARDPDRMAALSPRPTRPRVPRKRPAGTEADAALTAPLRGNEPSASAPAASEPAALSIGEKPIDMTRQQKPKHGGKRTKGGTAT